MPDFLLEIGVEEMPSEAIDDEALPQLKAHLEKLFNENRLKVDWKKSIVSATPRRLFALIPDFPARQIAAVTEIKGPPVKVAYKDGKPTQAASGFANSQGLKLSDLTVKKTEQGEYVYAVIKEAGKPSSQILKQELSKVVKSINFRKSMRWQSKLTFIRPIRWICCLLGDKAIEFEIDGLKSGNKTYGHRLLANKQIPLKNASGYLNELNKAKVIALHSKRADLIKKQLNDSAKKIKGKLNWADPRINQTFAEVINLVEWPTTLVGRFQKEFLVLPNVVIETVLQSHQRYFPVENNAGLMPYFLVVSNGNPQKKQLIKEGHERVVQARLDDGVFFFEEDIKKPINHRVEDLKGIIFHKKLGTIFDKQKRVTETSRKLASSIGLDKKISSLTSEASPLLKADLATSMVGEFAELQGAIGREYALVANINKKVADAVYEHYLPRFKGDNLPETRLGGFLSITDKIDTIVSYFSIGEIPTSTGDPYSLRRQANGIVEVILSQDFFFSLDELIKFSYRALAKQSKIIAGEKQIIDQVGSFMRGRLEHVLSNKGIDYDIIRGLLRLESTDFADIKERAAALTALRKTPRFDDLLTSYNRCLNLGKSSLGININEILLLEPDEKVFYKMLMQIEKQNKVFFEKRKYFDILNNLADLRKVIDKFFDEVLVMAKEKGLKENRLRLLNRYVDDCQQIADLSQIVMPG